DAAARAAGGALAGLEAILDGRVESAFCLLRPPGHHAEPAQAMGFCIFNSVAIAAAAARRAHELDRVAIVDFDVHHGNGTQDAFDAHFADPLAGQQLSVDGFGALLSMLASSADRSCGGRMLLALEGGYDLVALPWCIRRTLETLLRFPPTPDPLGKVGAPQRASLDSLIRQMKRLH